MKTRLCISLLLTVLALSSSGCPGSLEDPDRFSKDAGSGGGTGGSGATGGTSSSGGSGAKDSGSGGGNTGGAAGSDAGAD